jgi:hypothetical protein
MRNPNNTARNPQQGAKPPQPSPSPEATAKARTATFEAQAITTRTNSPARSSTYEAANAARVLEIVAYVARMASPDPARIAQALRTERPAVRRAVVKQIEQGRAA